MVMNRAERRRLNKIKKTEFYKVSKVIDDSLRGEGIDVDDLKGNLLAHVEMPEPIGIMFVEYNEQAFKDLASKTGEPVLYHLQEADGMISTVIFNGKELSSALPDLYESSRKEFHSFNLNSDEQTIEVIKCLNFTIEQLGGRYLDVVHLIFSKRTVTEILKQVDVYQNHFQKQYLGKRKLSIKVGFSTAKEGMK